MVKGSIIDESKGSRDRGLGQGYQRRLLGGDEVKLELER